MLYNVSSVQFRALFLFLQIGDPYVRDQQRMINNYEEVSSIEEMHNPFNDGEDQFDTDEDYNSTNKVSDSEDSDEIWRENHELDEAG